MVGEVGIEPTRYLASDASDLPLVHSPENGACGRVLPYSGYISGRRLRGQYTATGRQATTWHATYWADDNHRHSLENTQRPQANGGR